MIRRLSKFGARRTHRAGYSFASKLEANLFDLLKFMELGGFVKDIQVQPQVRLTEAEIIYKPDFKATDLEINQTVWFEAKGFETPEWRIKRKLWSVYGPGRLRVYAARGTNLFLKEEIIPERKAQDE